jgi:hypothetical protein
LPVTVVTQRISILIKNGLELRGALGRLMDDPDRSDSLIDDFSLAEKLNEVLLL